MVPLIAAAILATLTQFDEARLLLRCETAEAYLEQGLLEQAESGFRDALRLDPDCPQAVLGLGRIYRLRQAWEQSEMYLRQYTDSFPADPSGLMELAGLLMETCRTGEASVFALRAAEAASTDGAAWLLAGTSALACSDTAEAVRSLDRALELGGRTALEASVLLSGIEIASGEDERALELLVWGVESGHAPSCFRLGRLYVSWGDLVRGSALLQQCLYLSPSGPCSDSARMLLDDLAATGFFSPDAGLVDN